MVCWLFLYGASIKTHFELTLALTPKKEKKCKKMAGMLYFLLLFLKNKMQATERLGFISFARFHLVIARIC